MLAKYLKEKSYMRGSDIQYITTGDGCRIAYRLEGKPDAPVVLFANSIATTMQMWDTNIQNFTDEYHVLRYDLRGHGKSDAPAGPYSIDRMGYDVIEMLDALNIDKVHFVGLSLGGFIAQWLAVRAPERVDRLILVNTAANLGPREQYQNMVIKAQSASDMTFFAGMFMYNWFPQEMLDVDSRTTLFKQDILAMQPHALASSFAITRDFDMRQVIQCIKQPTLIIAGKHDKVTLSEQSVEIATRIATSELRILSTMHLSNVEQPAKFAYLVLDFLKDKS
jgi:3-oxoadipate enol-lactonase